MRTSSLSPLENVGKVSVSGALTWSELQKERGRAGRRPWADCTDLGALESLLGLRAGVRDRCRSLLGWEAGLRQFFGNELSFGSRGRKQR